MRCLLAITTMLLCGCTTVSKERATQSSPQSEPLASLTWMVGTWSFVNDQGSWEEHWMAPRSGVMLGLNRTTSATQPPFYEYLRIVSEADGLSYHASPMGRDSATAFRLTKQTTMRVEFENPTHDFPQRITYWLEGDTLYAKIDGTKDGRLTMMQWHGQRVQH